MTPLALYHRKCLLLQVTVYHMLFYCCDFHLAILWMSKHLYVINDALFSMLCVSLWYERNTRMALTSNRVSLWYKNTGLGQTGTLVQPTSTPASPAMPHHHTHPEWTGIIHRALCECCSSVGMAQVSVDQLSFSAIGWKPAGWLPVDN